MDSCVSHGELYISQLLSSADPAAMVVAINFLFVLSYQRFSVEISNVWSQCVVS